MKTKRRLREKTGLPVPPAALAAVVFLAVLAAAVAALGIAADKRTTIFPNVTVSGVGLGGKTPEEAHIALVNAGLDEYASISVQVVLTSDYTLTVTGSDAGLAVPISQEVEAAFQVGREGNFLENAFTLLRCCFTAREVGRETGFDEDIVRGLVSSAAVHVDHGAIQGGYEIRESEILIRKGSPGYEVDQEGVYEFIRDNLTSGLSAYTGEFSESASAGDGDGSVDLDALYELVFSEVQESVYDPETGLATPSSDGVTFDLEWARSAYASTEPGDTLRIPLTKTRASVSQAELQGLLYSDLLSSRMTSLYTSSEARITNVTLAAQAINGVVLEPGEIFSFNGTVGKATSARGFKRASEIEGADDEETIGGGICQVSSTLYYCTLLARLETVSRRRNSTPADYVPKGFDAAIEYDSVDFSFENSSEYPVRIVAYVDNQELYVELWGTKTDNFYVQLVSETVDTIAKKTVRRTDPSLAPGASVEYNAGSEGYVVDAYRETYNSDGTLFSRELLHEDTYPSHDRVLLVGPTVIADPEPSDDGQSADGSGESSGDEGGTGGQDVSSGTGEFSGDEGGIGGQDVSSGTGESSGDEGGTGGQDVSYNEVASSDDCSGGNEAL